MSRFLLRMRQNPLGTNLPIAFSRSAVVPADPQVTP